MDINYHKRECAENTETGIGYKTFYSDSEDIAKLMAISHIKSNMYCENNLVERPNIEFRSCLSGALIPCTLYSLITVAAMLLDSTSIWIFVAAYFIVFFLTIKYSVILLVLAYQKYAPERIRCSCCFEPTCSNYMLQAIEKYGFWRGFAKGINRLFRCHYPNGGIDKP